MLHLLAPTIEEYATAVEKDDRLDAGNSYKGILYELRKLPLVRLHLYFGIRITGTATPYVNI